MQTNPKNKKVLLLEDDPNLGMILQEQLEMNGFEVTLCVNGEEGSAEYKQGKYDLCLVDVMMPKKDGFTFVEEIRRQDQEIPVIFLTAKSLKEDKIKGFRIGCDDYLTKPFSMEELMLRIKAVLKRINAQNNQEKPVSFRIGGYLFDPISQILKIKENSQKLTARESELLKLLCLNLNHVLPREDALTAIWGNDNYFSGRSMDVYISKLRKYFQHDSRIKILSIHGKGYKLIIDQ